jgi:hypothetical protein
MPPKPRQPTQSSAPPTTSTPARSSTKNSGSSQDAQAIVQGVWNNYLKKTPQRVKLLDSFMAFLVVVGALQFVYCLIVGNFVSVVPTPLSTHLFTAIHVLSMAVGKKKKQGYLGDDRVSVCMCDGDVFVGLT